MKRKHKPEHGQDLVLETFTNERQRVHKHTQPIQQSKKGHLRMAGVKSQIPLHVSAGKRMDDNAKLQAHARISVPVVYGLNPSKFREI